MKILIDECLPVDLKQHLASLGHSCETVREVGLGRKKSGELLALAENKWDVLLTIDKNIKHQQNLAGRNISVLVMRARSNRIQDLFPQLQACAQALKVIQPGQILEV